MEYLANIALRSLLLAVVAGLALWICRVRSASARHAVWTLVTTGMLLQIVLIPVLPTLRLRVLRPVTLAPSVSVDESPMVIVARQPPASRLSVDQVVLCLYVAGALWCAAQLVYAWRFTRRLVRESTPLGERRYESRRISVPVTVGRTILLPLAWREWDAATLAAVLAHESAHVARSDWAVAAMARVNRCVFWFHPLAWWLERQLSRLAEQVCDDAALAVMGDREQYATVLMEMARAAGARGRRVAGVVAMAKEANVEKRINRILDASRRIPKALGRASWVALSAGGALLIYMAAAVQLAPAQSSAFDVAQIRPAVPAPPSTPMPGIAPTPRPQPKMLAQAVAQPATTPASQTVPNDPPQRRTDFSTTLNGPVWIPKVYNGRNKTFFFWKFEGLAQVANSGALGGMVRDPSGARVPNATVILQGSGGNRIEGRSSDNLGEWSLHLPPGTYSLEVQKPGFAAYRRSAIEIVAGVTQQVDANLSLGSTSEQVTISAAGTGLPAAQAVQSEPRIGGDVQPARRIKNVVPGYPPSARDQGITGTVVIQAMIGKSGKVLQATVMNDAPLELREAALAAVQGWEYTPTLLNGEPVDFVTSITINFQLDRQ